MKPRRAVADDRAEVVATLTRAFARDPVLRWLFPEDSTYPAMASAFFGGLFDLRLEGGEAWVLDGAVALWEPPGGNRLALDVRDRVWDRATAGVFEPEAMARNRRHEALIKRLLPADRGFYLGVLGVDPARQGQGLGRGVLQPVIGEADRQRAAACLETATATNLPFYGRLGFEVSAEAQHANGPYVWAMTRRPGASRVSARR